MPLTVTKLEQSGSVADAQLKSAQSKRNLATAREEIMKILKEDEEQVLDCLQALKNRQFAGKSATKGKKDDVGTWPSTYAQHWRIGKHWLAQWMLSLDAGVDAADLVKVDQYDLEHGLRRLLIYLTGVKPTDQLHKPLLCKLLTSRFYSTRYNMLGSRLKRLVEKCEIQTDGNIHYQVYKLLPAQGNSEMVGFIEHISGAQVVVPPGQLIPLNIDVLENWSDIDASISSGMVNCKLCTLFPEEVVPRTALSKDGSLALAKKLEAHHIEQAEQVTHGGVAEAPDAIAVINPNKRRAAKQKEDRESKKVKFELPSGPPGTMELKWPGIAAPQ